VKSLGGDKKRSEKGLQLLGKTFRKNNAEGKRRK